MYTALVHTCTVILLIFLKSAPLILDKDYIIYNAKSLLLKSYLLPVID
jgi:hypothetical protein